MENPTVWKDRAVNLLRQTNWEKVFIILALYFILLDFLQFPGVVTSPLHSDHGFHLLKFQMVKVHGLTAFPELGNVSLKLLLPVGLLPLVFLSYLIPPKIAYFGSYFFLAGVAYWAGDRLFHNRRREPLLAVLFPPAAYFLFRFGRILELAAHLPLLMLFIYLDEGDKKWVTTLLFFLGATSHLPTLLFYLIPLGLKLWDRRKLDHLIFWALSLLPWLGIYIPKSIRVTGWTVSRTEALIPTIINLIRQADLTWIIWPLLAFLMGTALATWWLGREGRMAFPAFLAVNFNPVLMYVGVNLLTRVPGLNQVLPITGLPLFAYLLYRRVPKLWWGLTLATALVLVWPVPWEGPLSEDFPVLDQINGSYVVAFPVGQRTGRHFITHYLASRGMPTPYCSTWEYSEPEWWHYQPGSCEALEAGLDYVIVYKTDQWVKSCDRPYLEGNHIIIVNMTGV